MLFILVLITLSDICRLPCCLFIASLCDRTHAVDLLLHLKVLLWLAECLFIKIVKLVVKVKLLRLSVKREVLVVLHGGLVQGAHSSRVYHRGILSAEVGSFLCHAVLLHFIQILIRLSLVCGVHLLLIYSLSGSILQFVLVLLCINNEIMQFAARGFRIALSTADARRLLLMVKLCRSHFDH